MSEPETTGTWTILTMDWKPLTAIIGFLSAILLLIKRLRDLRQSKAAAKVEAATPEQRALAGDLLDAVLQVKRLIKKGRQGFGDELAIQAALEGVFETLSHDSSGRG